MYISSKSLIPIATVSYVILGVYVHAFVDILRLYKSRYTRTYTLWHIIDGVAAPLLRLHDDDIYQI